MDNSLLVRAIEQYESQAETGDVAAERTKALDYYLGNPLGNEIEGRSQVISRDVWDTVEWIKPQLADIFCGGDEVVKFSPQGPEDVQAAEQETEYINHVITEKNKWFDVWYGWSHDALLQKVGYVKAYWDETEDVEKERYAGLTDDEAVLIAQDPEIELAEAERDEYGGWNITIERTKKYGCVRLVNVPPESVKVDANAPSLDLHDPRCNFSGHEELKTISQLRMDGFDVADDLSDGGTSQSTWEEAQRNPMRTEGEENTDPSMRKVLVRERWIRFDSDGDGKAELLHVIIVGKEILLEEPANQSLLVALCPTPLPHQHTGLSLADAVKDLQLIKTALLRGGLDSQALRNIGRYAINDETVNLDDMLVARSGGLVRVKGDPGTAIFPLTHPTQGGDVVPMMEYVDRISQKRTGVSEMQQGLDPNALNNNAGAHANSAMMTAAQQRIKFIARIFAESGVKTLFHLVHALTLQHSRQPQIVELRNQWVQIDPRSWKKRKDLKLGAALGDGDKAQQIMFLEGILQKQLLGLQAGLTSLPKVYNALKRYTQAGGYRDPNEFWDDPATTPPKPEQPNPEVLKEQAKAQAALQVEQMRQQGAIQIEQFRAQSKQQEQQGALALQASNDMRDHEREMWKAGVDAQLEEQKQALEQWKAQMQASVAQYSTDANNQTKLQIAGVQASQQYATQPTVEEQAVEAERQRMHEMEMAELSAITARHKESESANG